MRVLATILLVAVVLQGAFAVTSKATQAKLMIQKVSNKLEKSHLGRALKNMVTIATKLGYNYDDLYAAFGALRGNLANSQNNEEDLFAEQSAAHVAAVAQFNADISKYEAEIVDGESSLNSLHASLTQYQSLLADAQASLAQNQADREDAQTKLAELEEVYQTESDEYASVRVVISEAVEKLQEAQQHYDAAEIGGFSFVQLKNTFVSFAQKITAASSKLPSKHQLFVKPVIQAMMSVKTNTDQSSIQVAINALNDLQSYFDKALSDLTALYISFKASLEGAIADLSASIDLLENNIIPGYENQIQLLETEIQQTEEALALSKANLQAAQDGLVAENDAFAKTEARHNALIDRLNFEYDLVGQAERYIRHAQANLEA